MKTLFQPALVAVLICAACKTEHHPAPAPRWQEVVNSSKRVLAYRVSANTVFTLEVLRKHLASGGTGLPKLDEGKYVQSYPILLGPVEVPRRARQELARMLTDKRNYGYLGVDAGTPAIAFRFYGKNTVIEIIVSYDDGFMGVFERGELVFTVPICPVQNTLIQLVDGFLPRVTRQDD